MAKIDLCVGSWLLVNADQSKGSCMHKLVPGQHNSKQNTSKGTSYTIINLHN